MTDFGPILVAVVLFGVALLLAIVMKKYLRKRARTEVSEDGLPLLQRNDERIILPYQVDETYRGPLRCKDIEWSNLMTIFVNGSQIQLCNPDPEELLVNFIRDKVGLKGTKKGCEEGGCGSCTIALTNKTGVISVNSCLRPLCANDGMAITTVEGVGSLKDGMSEEQTRLVANNGTQCGFCTPGWITNMHALNQSNKSMTTSEIETYLDGNICRCTGYKPIFQAFKSFASDCTPEPQQPPRDCARLCASADKCLGGYCGTGNDVEDAACPCPTPSLASAQKNNCMTRLTAAATGGCGVRSRPLGRARDQALVSSYTAVPLMFFNAVTGRRWYRPVTLEQLCAVLREYPSEAVQLVGGNTSVGVTKYLNDTAPYNAADKYSVYVDINCVPTFSTLVYDNCSRQLTVGAGVSLSTVIEQLRKYDDSNSTSGEVNPTVNNHSLFSVIAHHLAWIANTQVRNAGTWAGNIMMFLRRPEFPSDAVLALTTANATLQLGDSNGNMISMPMSSFITSSYDDFQAQGLMILAVTFTQPSVDNRLVAETFKIAQRTQNAHAHVNAGFVLNVSQSPVPGQAPICYSARVVYGGVSQRTFVASQTERVLTNARLTSETLSLALTALQQDLAAVGPSTLYGDQAFRQSVMQNCLYRVILRCYGANELPYQLAAAVTPWVKPVSQGTEVFYPPRDADTPVGLPSTKLEAPMQATGQAVYPSDEPMSAQGLHAAMIFSSRCSVTLSGLDVSRALALSGVVQVFTAADIPGVNSVGKEIYLFVPVGEMVECVGAVLGVVVASTEEIANQAAALVNVLYGETGVEPIANITDAIAKKSFYKLPNHMQGMTYIKAGEPEKAMKSSYARVQGHVAAGGQTHFYMEAQSAVAKVVDGEFMDVVCGTQFPSGYQSTIAAMLGWAENKVTVLCPRTGGAFGGKITRGMAVSSAAALCSYKLGRPVRIFNTRTADMAMTGGREAFAFDYEVGFSADGLITALSFDVYVDAGMDSSDAMGGLYMGMNWADNAYYLPNYVAQAKVCRTNTPARTSMRAPGVVQACLATEMVIERVAVELGLPMHVVQQRNFIANGLTTILGQPIVNCTLSTVWDTLMAKTKYTDKLAQAQQYNANNLWRKKGVSIAPVKYGIGWNGYNAGCRLGVRTTDGTVLLTHSGCEIGQGINTKAAQAVANALGIDLSLVRVTSTSTEKVVNGSVTGGSGTSEVICQAAVNACMSLNERLNPFRTGPASSLSTLSKAVVGDTAAWLVLLQSLPCDVSLNVDGWYSPVNNPNGQPFQYFVYAACVTEVELDVLSGNVHVLSSDISYDCGQSLNPAVDIGQIEGGLVMGLGYFLTERVEYDSNTGSLLTNGTWEYKPPTLQDIPSEISVTLLPNLYNQDGILGSKAVGEPPYVIANSIYFALKMAIASARADAMGASSSQHFDLEVPATVELRQKACLTQQRLVLPC